MAKLLGRAQILGAVDLKRETVAVPEWGGSVIVQELSAGQAGEFMAMATAGVDLDSGEIRDTSALFGLQLWLAAASMVDEAGVPLFAGAEDLAALGRKNRQPIERVAEVAKRLSGLDRGAAEDAQKKS